MLTIEDIRNPKTKTGFRYVKRASEPGPRGGGPRPGASPKWQANKGRKARGSGASDFWGPRRSTPEAAAQDYCDYINGSTTLAAPTLKRPERPERDPRPQRSISQRERDAREVLRQEISKNPPRRVHAPVVYLIGEQRGAYVKIGHADYDVESRVASLQTGNPRELKLLATLSVTGPTAKPKEREIHAKFVKQNVLNEWFTPSTELLAVFGLTLGAYRKATS